MDDAQIKRMVDRFLAWKLPADFSPDAGITFTPEYNTHMPRPGWHEPTGTNLLNAQQAEEMIRHLLGAIEYPPVTEAQIAADPWLEAFMRPEIEWIAEPGYVAAFRELTGERPMATEAAWTSPSHPYPAFINVAAVGEDTLQVTVRTAESQEVSRICMPLIEWQQLVAHVGRLQFPGAGPNEHDDREHGAVAGDPLAQRAAGEPLPLPRADEHEADAPAPSDEQGSNPPGV